VSRGLADVLTGKEMLSDVASARHLSSDYKMWVPPPITETQNVSRWDRGGRAAGGIDPWPLDPKGARHSALPAWDAGSLAWVKFCHGNKRCQPPSPLRP
jgi:hypothetical protein